MSIFLLTDRVDATRQLANIMSILPGAHIASLLLALWLVRVISVHQDRRLKV